MHQRIDPIGPRTDGPGWVMPVAGMRRVERREEDEPRREREPRRRSPSPPRRAGAPDAAGHVDVEV
ncbi:hypothetical protein [Capillimicrobium parvum]|uniref:Uncharacterized protein n=1 Tax=Capillimicrobium parvum TaxID=2884022 RepID=A0A9E7BWA2_9ACTN|nr:hypothetical protein [Capillimicrobium parvum]UGS33751.1 hypothetical protein DSM104329_00116 [Capillimicrobium parvum]